MGHGLFSNFWERERPFTLESKCVEIFHWRDGAHVGADGNLAMDEARVAQAVRDTQSDPVALQTALERTMRLRDPQGVYAEGGCIDASREFPRSVSVQGCQLVLPRFSH
jgi:predicted dinucleotide-utilizing enzyme